MAIRLLPENLVNRIAAGEVIERPAACVKELVENALDAGATRILVRIAGGGIERIEVVDDGAGMSAADLALSVQRHATSKLGDDDLVRIKSLGFRGEALPSIGAVARLAIISRPHDAESAAEIRVEGGAVAEVAPAAGAAGTRVVVADLFYATPARRKFLKSPQSEGEQAAIMLRRLAMAAPEVAFRFESDGKLGFDLPAQKRRDRFAGLIGAEAGESLIAFTHERGDLRLQGLIAPPAFTRANGAQQYFTVNGRSVTDPELRTGLKVAVRDVIEAGRYPIAALWLDLPAEELDVNVHPAKAELRFRDPQAVRGLVISAVRSALAQGAGPSPAPFVSQFRPAMAFYPASERGRALPGAAEAQLPLAGSFAARVLAEPATPSAQHPLGAAVAQVLDTYIIAVAADGSLVLVDQHAAHERLTHEALAAQMRDGGVRSQPLLLPAIVTLSAADCAHLLRRAAELGRLGLELEPFGGDAILVRALPAALGAPDPAPLLRDLADELAEWDEAVALESKLDAVVARLACHGSIRAGRRLLQAEMDALLRQMEATPRAATCSHGRPTFLKMSKLEIEKLFGRK